jgi:hypothetical protein
MVSPRRLNYCYPPVKVESTMEIITQKHVQCLQELFPTQSTPQTSLQQIIQNDLNDIRDILKTLALMKWQNIRIGIGIW